MTPAPIREARRRAAQLYRSEGFQAAYVRGARAAMDGAARETCPYRRSPGTWRNVFRRAWLRGYDSIA